MTALPPAPDGGAAPGTGPTGCAYLGCTAAAVHRRWCGTHRDARGLYLEARAAGMSRGAAARQVGVLAPNTYGWEPAAGPGRREDYWFLRGIGVPVAEAAARVGVTLRSARRWERRTRTGAAA